MYIIIKYNRYYLVVFFKCFHETSLQDVDKFTARRKELGLAVPARNSRVHRSHEAHNRQTKSSRVVVEVNTTNHHSFGRNVYSPQLATHLAVDSEGDFLNDRPGFTGIENGFGIDEFQWYSSLGSQFLDSGIKVIS